MERATWIEEDTAFDGTLSFDEGLQEIDSFYASQEAPQNRVEYEPALLGAPTTDEDEFSTLMDDIDQLTAAASYDATQAASNIQPHSLANQHDSNGGLGANLQQNNTATQVVNTKQLSSNADIHNGIATPPHRSPASLQPEPQSSQLAGLDDLPQTQGPSLDPSLMPDLKMTRSKREYARPPSSGRKSSLLEEMRSEEQNPERRHALRVEVPKPEGQIHLPGIDVKGGADDSELANVDVQSEPDAPSSLVSVQTKLRDAAIPRKKSSNMIVHHHPEPDAVKRPAGKGHKTKAEEELFPDLLAKSADENLSPTTTRPKRKKNARSDGSDLDNSGIVGNVSKKKKTRGQQSERQVSVSTPGVESTASQRAPRNALGQNEMKKLTESVLLAGEIPPRGRSAARQTRAQKEEEARKAPNAGRAAKERHRGK